VIIQTSKKAIFTTPKTPQGQTRSRNDHFSNWAWLPTLLV